MGSATPEEAIRDSLAKQSALLSALRGRRQARGSAGWIAETAETLTGGMDARPESTQFLRARRLPDREVHAVTLELPNGMFTCSICCVKQDASGDWWPVGASSGTVNGRPAREQLWALLGGGGWPKQFYAGAYVDEDDEDVARMRLRSANGVVLDDTIDHGVALFITDEEVTLPIEADIYDMRGNLLGQRVAFQ